MEIAAPGEMICTDFADFGRISLCIIKDRFSGLLAVYVTKDKTSESAIRCIRKWMHRYGLLVEVRSDQGPSYSAAFVIVSLVLTMHKAMEQRRRGSNR